MQGSCIPTLQHHPLGYDSTKCCLYSDPTGKYFTTNPPFSFLFHKVVNHYLPQNLCVFIMIVKLFEQNILTTYCINYIYISLLYCSGTVNRRGFAVTETGIKMYWCKDKLKPKVVNLDINELRHSLTRANVCGKYVKPFLFKNWGTPPPPNTRPVASLFSPCQQHHSHPLPHLYRFHTYRPKLGSTSNIEVDRVTWQLKG